MATTFTGWNNDVLTMAAIQAALKNALIPLGAFSSAVSVERRVQSDVVRVPVMTAITTSAKTPGTASTSYGGAATTSVTLSTYREASWQLNEGSVSAAEAPVLFAAMAAEATYGLAKYVIDLALAEVTAANFGTSRTIAAGDFGMNDLGLLWQDAEGKKMGRDRSLVLNAAYTGSLIGESNLGLILATMGDKGLMSAQLPPLMGFKCFNYSALPTTGNLGGFVCDKNAIAVALAPPEPLVAAGEGNKIADEVITDPDSSVVCRYIRLADADGGYHKGRVEVLIGVEKIQDSLVRIISA